MRLALALMTEEVDTPVAVAVAGEAVVAAAAALIGESEGTKSPDCSS